MTTTNQLTNLNVGAAGTDAHPISNVVQIAQGIAGGSAPTNAQIQTELEATKAYLAKGEQVAGTAKEEKAMMDARKLVEAAQTTIVAKNSDEKMQRLAAQMTSMGMTSADSGSVRGKRGRKQYNQFMRKLKDITVSFTNSTNFRQAFLDLVRILRDIFNISASNSGLAGQGLRDTLRNQLGNIRQSRQQGQGMLPGQFGPQTGFGAQTGFGPQTGHHQTGILPGQTGFGPQTGHQQTGILPGQTGFGAQTGYQPGQPGYVAPMGNQTMGMGNQTMGMQPQTSLFPNIVPTGGLLSGNVTSPASTSLLPGQPGYVAPMGNQTMGMQAMGSQPMGNQTMGLGNQMGMGNQTMGMGSQPMGMGMGQQSGVSGQVQQVAQNVMQNIPDDQKQLFVQQLKQFLHESNANPEISKAIRELFSVWGSLNGGLYSQIDSLKANTAGTGLPQTAKEVIEEFTGDRSIDDFLEYLRYAVQIVDADLELREFLSDMREFLLMAIEDPELVESQDYYTQGSELLTRGRWITQRYANHPVFFGLFEEARLLSEEVKNDATLNLLKNRTQVFFGNFVYKDPRTNTPKIDFDLMDKMRATLIPFIVERIHEVPIPRIEMSNKDFEYLIVDDLHLLLGNILPDQITIHSRSLAKIAAEARGAISTVDANAPASRHVMGHPSHVRTNVGDTSVHIKDDSRYGEGYRRDDYSSSDDEDSSSSSTDEEYKRPTKVHVAGRDVSRNADDVHPNAHTHTATTPSSTAYTTSTSTVPVAIATDAPILVTDSPVVTSAAPVVASGAPVVTSGTSTTHNSLNNGSRIRFRIANIKPEFRNFYFSMKKIKTPALTDEGRMNMFLKGKGLTIVGAFSLIQNAAGQSQITNQRIRVSMGRVKFEVLEAKHKFMLKLGFLFMGKTISRQVETAVQQKLEKLVVEWSDVLNQKVMTHLPPVDQLAQRGVGVVSSLTDKAAEKTN